MSIQAALQSVVDQLPDCLAAGFVDIGTGMLLEVQTVDSHPAEVLDIVAAATADLFEGSNVTAIEQLFKKARGLPEHDSQHYFQEILVFSENLLHFFQRGREDPRHVLCLVCRKSANVGIVLNRGRSQLTMIESIFHQQGRPKATISWAATRSVEVNGRTQTIMDDQVDLAADDNGIQRDVLLFYDHDLGHYPKVGLHQLFVNSDRTVDGWVERLDSVTARHVRKITQDVTARLERGDCPNPRFALMAYERWRALYSLTRNEPSDSDDLLANDADYRDDWRDVVAMINEGRWDPQFCERVGFDAPASGGFEALAQRDAEAAQRLLHRSWNHFAQQFLLSTIGACQQACRTAKWGLIGYPLTPYPGYSSTSTTHIERHNELEWMWSAVDVLAPTLFARRYTVTDRPSKDAEKENSVAQDRAYIESVLTESLRVRDRFAFGKPLIVMSWYRYHITSGSHRRELLNATNLDHQFALPLRLGVDGVAVLGRLSETSESALLQRQLGERILPAMQQAMLADDDDESRA